MKFPGNKGYVSCFFNTLSPTPPPPLPGGYAVGETVYYTAESKTLEGWEGYKLTHGESGEVMGHPPSDTDFGKRVSVMFPGNKGSVHCLLTQLSRSKP